MSRLSRRMAHALRHAPEAHGLTLTERGEVEIAQFARAMGVSVEAVTEVAQTCPKQRFSLSPAGMIRATQGHSTSTLPTFVPSVAPRLLFHGTQHFRLPGILSVGLIPGKRTHVHLTASHHVAAARGPVVLTIETAGLAVQQTENGVWLARWVPREAIHRLGLRFATGTKRRTDKALAALTPTG